MESRSLAADKKFADLKIKLASFGMIMSLISSFTLVIFQNFNASAQEIVFGTFETNTLTNFMLVLMMLGICEGFGGILVIIFNKGYNGIPFREYPRVAKVKISWLVLISAVIAGPIATACTVSGVFYCGSTYSNIILTLMVVFTAIGGQIFLKEKINSRMYVGVVLVVLGCIIAGWAKPDAVESGAFYFGIVLCLLAAIGFAAEAVISTHAMDVCDPLELCGMFRMVGAALVEFLAAFLVAVVTGNLALLGAVVGFIFHSPLVLMFLLLTGFFQAWQYGLAYTSWHYCGAVRSNVLIWSTPIWSIPISLIFEAMGILEYNVTMLAIVGAIVVVFGVVLVNCKPSELFNLRKM